MSVLRSPDGLREPTLLGKLEQLVAGVDGLTVCNKQVSKIVDLDTYETCVL